MSKREMNIEMEVARTGKLEQFYTLYYYTEIIGNGFYVRRYRYVQNMSHDKDTAMEKAKIQKTRLEESGVWNRIGLEYVESPKREFVDLKAFGMDFRQGKKAYWAYATSEFWDEWKKRKDEIKAEGFWVSKWDGQWMVYWRVDFDQYDAMDAAFTDLARGEDE